MTDRRRRIAAGMSLALALVFATVWWWRSDLPSAPQGTSKGSGVSTPASPPTTGAALAAAPARRPRTRLPPPDAPLPDIVPTLQARADAGDSLAACRLAMELLRCDQVDAGLRHFDKVKRSIESLEADGNLTAAEMFTGNLAWKLAQRDRCAEVAPALRARTADYLTQAARAGEPDAMLHYADAAHLGGLEGLALHRAAEFEAWRREAPAMLERALRAGRGEAVLILRLAYSGDFSAIGGLIEDDPVEAQVYSLMFARMVGGTEQLNRRLTPQQLARARALADERYEKYLASRPADAGPLQPMLRPPGMGSDEGLRTFCERQG